ncbi:MULTISPECIES: YkyA family protein [Allobacillus]|uniref:Cell-wall binding lipoprotein n=1 Tax=Allobacillus salarius TaxID=1955272 RepID=A0A556PLU2_9BACI|nr:YkyA family protein [Allobacillus salarius]TSJ65361.1 hypothetical protein FPQ13_07280 [Allobacillus salarius]
MKKLLLSICILILSITLVGCNSSDQTKEEIYNYLEEAVQKEKDFQEAQNELVEVEKEESKLYEQMIEINMEEIDQVKEKAEKAKELSQERKQIMEKEMESIKAGKEEFDKMIPLVEELENEEAKGQANEMIDVMENRYKSFAELHETYLSSIESDQKLYDLLMDEELDKETLDEQVNEINQKYEEITTHQEEFNELTNQFNELKKQFYETIELDVQYEE